MTYRMWPEVALSIMYDFSNTVVHMNVKCNISLSWRANDAHYEIYSNHRRLYIERLKIRPFMVQGSTSLVDVVCVCVPIFRAGFLTILRFFFFEEPEPLPRDHPLLKMPNVVLTPHIGSATPATRMKMFQMTIDNLCAALLGQQLLHEVQIGWSEDWLVRAFDWWFEWTSCT